MSQTHTHLRTWRCTLLCLSQSLEPWAKTALPPVFLQEKTGLRVLDLKLSFPESCTSSPEAEERVKDERLYRGHQPDSQTPAQTLVFLYWASFCSNSPHFLPSLPFLPGAPSAFLPPPPSSPESQSLLGTLCLAQLLPGGILSLKCRVGAQEWARGWEEGVQEGEEMLFILALEAVGVGQRKKVQEPSSWSHLLG